MKERFVPKAEKERAVAALNERFSRVQAAVLTGFSGLTVAQMEGLRRGLRRGGAEFFVVKNSMARLAARGTPLEGLAQEFVGPTAVAVALDDPVAPAKVLTDFLKNQPSFQIKIGLLEGRVIGADEIKKLASLPGREVLLAQLLGSLQSPVAGLVGVLSGLLRNLLGVLEAIREKKEV